MGRFKLCSNKCRLRELNGDLQTIASCSIGPGGGQRGAPRSPDGQIDAKKMYSGFDQSNSASCDKRRSWAAYSVGNHGVGAAGREGREMWRWHPWEGSAAGRLVRPPSKSEDKDTWRGPGMLMANSTPTIHHGPCVFGCITVNSNAVIYVTY